MCLVQMALEQAVLEVQRAVDAHPTSVVAAPPDTEPVKKTALLVAAQITIYFNEIEAALRIALAAVKVESKNAMHDLKMATTAAVAQTTMEVTDTPIAIYIAPTEAQTETPTAIALIYESPYGIKYHNREYCGRSGQMTIANNAPIEFAPGDTSLCEKCYGRRVVGPATA